MSGVTRRISVAFGGVLMSVALLTLVGCESVPTAEQKTLTGDQDVVVQPGDVHDTYATPDEGVKALLDAVQDKDHDGLKKIFGPAGRELVSGDPVEDENAYKLFAARTLEKAQIEERTPDMAILHIGQEDWPFPIPIVKNGEGRWYFDTKAGQQEIIARRVGANELNAISVCREYISAQQEYAALDRDQSGIHKYAQRLKSREGMKDGLYWDSKDGEGQSPFGPLADTAQGEGYAPISGAKNTSAPYHGYHFHILTAQGPDAAGGAYSYIINGNMIAGFAMISWPDQYGNSGVMTFIVSHQGKVYQKDLGPDTANIAKAMTAFNPDASWTEVK